MPEHVMGNAFANRPSRDPVASPQECACVSSKSMDVNRKGRKHLRYCRGLLYNAIAQTDGIIMGVDPTASFIRGYSMRSPDRLARRRWPSMGLEATGPGSSEQPAWDHVIDAKDDRKMILR